jgi:hypothetical protein
MCGLGLHQLSGEGVAQLLGEHVCGGLGLSAHVGRITRV